VKKIAQKHALPIIDLYSASLEYAGMHWDDGVHFFEEGYEGLARKLLEALA
jgi:hypothetical protein